MSLKRWIRGYDVHTEVLRGQWEIPSNEMHWVQRIVNSQNADDPDFLDSYPLTRAQARAFGYKFNLPLDATAFDYFLEADEDWKRVTELRDSQQLN
jgi:hypothetical protein